MDAEVPPGTVVVVIDVIRAFTTAAVAFERGATEILCAATSEAGRDLRRRYPDCLLVGETGGLKPADFDVGNSPFEMSTARLRGRRLVQATSNGTRGLVRHRDPVALLAASARNAAATARWIRTSHAGAPCTLVCTGRTAEDLACARYLSDLLQGAEPGRAELVAGITRGAAEHARAYASQPESGRLDLSDDLPVLLRCGPVRFRHGRRGPRRSRRPDERVQKGSRGPITSRG
ncbi:2-phosphosulfolactate phosphatase [Actinoplanes sp. TBRC 11911]|uniref:2-phosphosulfolactate phosphatase n=1 Tax=Actinoplanes sp. TBRC 11911 TaxID=2729386 RepID=UPI0037C08690